MKRKSRSAIRVTSPKETSTLRSGRERWHKLLAATLIPVLLFGGLELALWLAGYGYATNFFRKTQIGGRDVWVANDDFGLRFFPRSLARVPPPTVFPVAKGSNTFRIFILGESAALGDPEPAFGFGRYLEVLLQERFPDRQFEVICAAMTAINSHALLPIAQDCAQRDGDLWVIYMGNNEVVGPYGAATVFGPKAPPRFLIRASLALKATRTGQLLDALIHRDWTGAALPATWQGMRLFLEAKTRPDDSGRRRTDENFRANLEAILRLAHRHQIPVLLCTVASNLKDCAPFASLHAPQFDAAQDGNWETLIQAGANLEAAQDWSAALAQYEKAAALDGDYAELQFRLGRCHLALNQLDAAQSCFERARDLDALPFRTTATQNEIIRQTAAAFVNEQVSLLDVAHELGPIPGAESFYEHVHFNFAGNERLARLVAESAARWLPVRQEVSTAADWPATVDCEQQLAITPWDRYRVFQNVWQREQRPPFTQQLNHSNQLASLEQKLQTLRSQTNSNALPAALGTYTQALQHRPDDFSIRGNFAKLLEDTGDLTAAATEWQQVGALLPYHFGPAFYLGRVLARLGRLEEAENQFHRALQLRADLPDAQVELGRVLLRQNRPAAALAQIQPALAQQPDNARLYLDLAEAQAALGQREVAMTSLRQAIQLRSDFWEARYLLGVELALRNDLSGAREQFVAVIRLKPDHALAHLNLGVALAKERRLPEAVEQFRQTLRLDPSNQAAAQYLKQLRAD